MATTRTTTITAPQAIKGRRGLCSLSTKLFLFLLVIHLTCLANWSGHCADSEEFESVFIESDDLGETRVIEGFHVDPNLADEIDDEHRSRREREKEATSTSTRHPFEHACPYGYFACHNGECIAPKWRCDGHYDCDDFSDELDCTTFDLPQHSSMGSLASTTYKAPPSRPNVTRGADGAPITSLLSTQVYGLNFNSTIEPLMIFSTGNSIRGLWMRSRIYFDIVIRQKNPTVPATQPSITDAFSLFFGMFGAESQAVADPSSASGAADKVDDGGAQKPDNTIVGLDMDPNNKEVFWVELGKEPGVYSAVIEDDQFEARHKRKFHGHKKVVEFGLLSPEDIALDTVGKNAYITDAGLPAIVVCSYVHVHCKIIQQDKIHKPRAIIADSSRGWITFTDWGDSPGIFLQSMDGQHFEHLIDTDVVWPNGLAVDYATNHLYWADARLGKIERVDLVSRSRRVLVQHKETNPFSVTMFENRIYWSDWSKNEIKTCNKDSGNGTATLMSASDIYGIHIYHPELSRTDLGNPCWSRHCSHMCLLSPATPTYSINSKKASLTATCACPDSMALSILDKSTCLEIEMAFLLINVRNYVAQVFPERIGLRVVEEIVYSREHAIQDIAADWLNYRLFFFDAAHQKIYSADFNQAQPKFENVTQVTSKSIRGFLFDHMSDNLHWLDPEAGALAMFSMPGKFQRVLNRKIDHPVSMVLDSRNRVFYIACHGVKPHIMRIDVTGVEQSMIRIVDGTSRRGFGLPVALHLDEQLQRLYWADAHLETIESVDLDVKSRSNGLKPDSFVVHRKRLGTILGFAVYHDSFMWTRQNDGYLYKAKMDKSKRHARPVVFKLPPNPSHEHPSADYKRLVTVNPLNEATSSACQSAQCSHGCLLDSSHAARCLCPDNFKLSIMNRTNCIEQTAHEDQPIAVVPTGESKNVAKNHAAATAAAAATAPSAASAAVAVGVVDSGALHNIIAHLDDLGTTMSADATRAKHAANHEEDHHQMHWPASASISTSEGDHHLHQEPEQQKVEAAAENRESNRIVWLIVFLLILSAAAVVTALSLLVLHRQGRLPRPVSVSFISPGTALGASRASDKDRAMLLLDTDN